MAGRLAFSYRSGKTILHRLPAGFKLFCVMLLSAVAYSSLYGLAAAILALLIVSVPARIPPWELLRGSKPLCMFALCVIAMKTFESGGTGITTPEIIICNYYIPDIHIPGISASGFFDGVITVVRIFVPFSAAALLFSVTTMRELRLSLGVIEAWVKKTLFPRRPNGIAFFSLSLSLMLGFIPRFFELWEASNLACDARSHRRGLRRLFIIVPLLTERMMEAAADTALALEARGLN